MSETETPAGRVAEVLQRLRSGVRQRTAETATAGAGAEELRRSLLAVRSREYLEEPVAFSHRRRLGRWIVLSRKAFFHLFLKWFLRPVIAQQNAFNQAVGRLLEELAEAEERQLRELGELARRVEELERQHRDPSERAQSAEPVEPSGHVEPAAR